MNIFKKIFSRKQKQPIDPLQKISQDILDSEDKERMIANTEECLIIFFEEKVSRLLEYTFFSAKEQAHLQYMKQAPGMYEREFIRIRRTKSSLLDLEKRIFEWYCFDIKKDISKILGSIPEDVEKRVDDKIAEFDNVVNKAKMSLRYLWIDTMH